MAHVMAVLNTTHHKYTIEKYGLETQLFWKFLISWIFLTLIFYKNIWFEKNIHSFISILMIAVTSLIVTIFANKLLKDVSIQKFVAIMMLNMPITYIIDLVLKNREFSFIAVMGILLIIVTNYKVVYQPLKEEKSENFFESTSPIFIILFVGISRTVFINHGINQQYFSQAFVNYLFFGVIFLFAAFFYRKKIMFSKKIISTYSLQSIFNVGLNFAIIQVMSYSVFLPSIIAAISNMITVLISRYSLKNNLLNLEKIGIITGTVGVLLIIFS